MATNITPILWWKGEDTPNESQAGVTAVWNITPDYDSNQAFKIVIPTGTNYALSVPNNSLFNFDPSSDFSVRLSVKNIDHHIDFCYLVGKGNYSGGTDAWLIGISNGNIIYRINKGTGNITRSTTGNITNELFHDVLFTYSNGFMRVYLDSVDVTITTTQYLTRNLETELYFGNVASDTFNGSIGNIRIYDQVISVDNDDEDYSDHISIDFVGVPRSGSSPLVVDFTASVVKDNVARDKNISVVYNWFFDYENNPSVYETTIVPTISHVYSGYHKQTFDVKLSAIAEITN